MPIPCPKCRRNVPEDRVLCLYCGARLEKPAASLARDPAQPALDAVPGTVPLPDTLPCPRCRRPAPASADACPVCGALLAQPAAELIDGALAGLTCAPGSAEEVQAARRAAEKGREALRAGHTLAALQAFERALLIFPHDGWILAHKAGAQAHAGDFGGALKTLAQAIAREPGNASFRDARARLDRLKREAVLAAAQGQAAACPAPAPPPAPSGGAPPPLPPGRPGATLLRSVLDGGKSAAYALHGSAQLLRRGLLPNPEAIASFNWVLTAPEGSPLTEIQADVMARDGSVFVFRFAADGAEMAADALAPEELETWRALLRLDVVARVTFCGNLPWGALAATRLDQAGAGLGEGRLRLQTVPD